MYINAVGQGERETTQQHLPFREYIADDRVFISYSGRCEPVRVSAA